MATLILDKNAVSDLLRMPEVIDVVEAAFRDWAGGRATMPPKAYLLVDNGDFRAMPAALPGGAGVKWVNAHPHNPARGLPTVMAVLIYNDPETGHPLAIMDATRITSYRTGATAAIAARCLARPEARTLGIVGAGYQARAQIMAHTEFFDLMAIKVFDVSGAAVDRLIAEMPQFPIRRSSLTEAVAADIVCTLTPSRSPIIRREWVAPGTHINAVGADAAGKEELEPALLQAALVVVDDVRQAGSGGEINVPVKQGLFRLDDIYATLAEVLTGQKPGRPDAAAITIFDSTGVAIEDLAVARSIFGKAQAAGGYPAIDLV